MVTVAVLVVSVLNPSHRREERKEKEVVGRNKNQTFFLKLRKAHITTYHE